MSSYHDELKALAERIGSDGCTHALEVDVVCCWEHDYAYVTGLTPRAVPVTKDEADERFRDCIQSRSSFRYFSPLSWWRWLAVKRFGKGNFPRHFIIYDTVLDEARCARVDIMRAMQARGQ